MRILFVAGPSYGLVFPLVPLAWALRTAGHEVLFTGPANTAPAAGEAGLPFVASSAALEMPDFMMVDREGRRLGLPDDEDEMLAHMGRGFARLAAYSLDGLLATARAWRPDLVVGSTFHYAAPLLAGALRVPWVNQGVELSVLPGLDTAAGTELAPELSRLGLDALPATDLLLDACPPGLRRPGEAGGEPFRFVPFNRTGPLEPWMLRKPTTPRICVTLGSRVSRGKIGGLETLDRLVRALPQLGAEVVVAATPEIAAELGPLPAGFRAGWLPLDVVVPTCDLVLHHGGGNTMLSCLVAGVPQLLLPYMVNNRLAARRLRDFGLAEVLEPGADTTENVVRAVGGLLADQAARQRARAVAEEIAGQLSPRDVAARLPQLVAARV